MSTSTSLMWGMGTWTSLMWGMGTWSSLELWVTSLRGMGANNSV